jgi:LysM repeat protein
MATSGGSVEKAVFINLENGPPFKVQYNPSQFQYSKSSQWKDHEVQGTTPKSLEFQKNAPASLSMELIFDTTNEGSSSDVRTKYVNALLFLTNPKVKPQDGQAGDIDKERPPVVTFVWGSFTMTGVVEKIDVTYLMFSSSGTPLRAKVNVTLKEWLPEEHANGSGGRGWGNDRVTLVTMGPGETVSAVAIRMGVSTSQLCSDNGIDNPFAVSAGTQLVVRR